MHILIEEYGYKKEDVADILGGLVRIDEISPTVSVSYVGYYYNPSKDVMDSVLILPKVLLDENDKVFGHIEPSELLDFEKATSLSREERDFIYEFTVWIYQTIRVFSNTHPDNDIVREKTQLQTMGRRILGKSHTFLDVIIAIQKFYRENNNFFMYVLKNIHSGFNKINWTRTVAHSRAVIEDEEPVYLDLANKKRRINYDEELFIIFFSILHYVSGCFGFSDPSDMGFELIRGHQFERYLHGYGKTRLKQIKYKYFSDKALQMWDLCYAFFDSAYRIRVSNNRMEYLLVKNFNIVFEAIIDELIGDKDIPKGLKEQENGKLVDHMYTYKGLVTNDDDKLTYYIGDSKYYKLGNEIGKESIYKQFTYARNVIQWNLNLFMDGDEDDEARKSDKLNFAHVEKLRDDEVEGYNVIPNFFISAKLNEKLSYKEEIERTGKKNTSFFNRQFDNRLFDRDTLLVFHYDVNFLYVVSLYARNNVGQKRAWKEKVRKMFREETQKLLVEKFDFYAMAAHPDVDGEAYIKEHFQEVLGKIYTPYSDKGIYSLALDKSFPEDNEDIIEGLRKCFYIEPCKLGENPQPIIEQARGATSVTPVESSRKNGVLMVMMEDFAVKSPKFLPDGKIAVGVKMNREGVSVIENLHTVGYVLFHTWNDAESHLYAVKCECQTALRDELKTSSIYRNIDTTDVFVIVEMESSAELDTRGLSLKKITHTNKTRYDARFATIDELRA